MEDALSPPCQLNVSWAMSVTRGMSMHEGIVSAFNGMIFWLSTDSGLFYLSGGGMLSAIQ